MQETCETCHIPYHDRAFLYEPRMNRQEQLPYLCSLCNKSFTENEHLTRHMLYKHNRQKLHPWAICGTEFNLEADLTKHMLIHSEDRPFICGICGKSFVRKDSLTKHMAIHIGNKPHRCEYCCKSFTEKCNLVLHNVIHTGEKPHRCLTCGKSFTQKVTLSICLYTLGISLIVAICVGNHLQ